MVNQQNVMNLLVLAKKLYNWIVSRSQKGFLDYESFVIAGRI